MTATSRQHGPQPPAPVSRSGYVALVGLPNVGKSTLLNRLVGRPLSIVAPRPQTTRHRVVGILNGEGWQAVFVDTPGMLKPAYKLQEMMVREVEGALGDADVLLMLIDAERPGAYEPFLQRLPPAKTLVVLNKVDRLAKEALLPLAARVSALGYRRVFMTSALRGSGVDDLKAAVAAALPPGEPYFPTDAVSERSERFFAAEIVREAVFNRYGEEIPYSTTVTIEEFREREGRKDYIRAVIYVERESQKAILVGKGGQALKRVGEGARRRIEQFLGRPVYLELWVKVAENWRRDARFLQDNVYGRE